MKKRFLASIVCCVVAAPVVMLAVLILSKPERFSTQFLKTGGRLVKKAVDNVDGVVIVLTVSVVLLWGIIMLACWLQSSREDVVS